MCTADEKRERVTIVLDLILRRKSRREILQFAAKQEWHGNKGKPISDRAVDDYIAEAAAELKELAKTCRETQFGKALASLDLLFAKSYEIQDYKTARAIQKDISDLFGLDAPKKSELTGKDGKDLIPDAAAALEARLDSLIAAEVAAGDTGATE